MKESHQIVDPVHESFVGSDSTWRGQDCGQNAEEIVIPLTLAGGDSGRANI
jgi:hypothetical protein